MRLKRSTTHGLNAATMTLIVIGILGAVNFIGTKRYIRFDFTKQKQFSLAPQSIKVVKSLTEDIEIMAFMKAEEKPIFDDLMDKYTYHSKRVKPLFVDVDKDIALAKEYKVKRYGTLIIKKGKKETRIDSIKDEQAEEKVTNAIIKVGKEKTSKLYFTKGHDEKSIGDNQREGYSVVKEELEKRGYLVDELSLLETGAIPDDCDVLVIGGPEKPFLKNEIVLIETYMKSGGRLMVFLDPQDKPLGLNSLLQKVGITAEKNVVIDPISTLFGQGASTPVVSQYSSHVIVVDMKMPTFYPLSRSLSIASELPNKNIQVEALATTSPNSWGETSPRGKKAVRFNKGKDRKGPLNIAVVAEGKWDEKGKELKLLAFGDSDFINNRSYGFSGNGNLFLNAVAWMVDDETSISIRPEAAGRRRIYPERFRRDESAKLKATPRYAFSFLLPKVASLSSRP